MTPSKRPFEAQLARLSLLASVPLLLLLLWVMVYADVSIYLTVLTGLLGCVFVLYTNHLIYQKLVYQFRSLNNLLDALIRGDYSLRARADQSFGELGELVSVINGLAQRLSDQRRESVESQLLVSTILEHIDVAIVALDAEGRIRFINPAAKKLLLVEARAIDDELQQQLAFAQSLPAGYHQVVELALGHQQGRFNVHVEEFRESGLQHKLLFITDVRILLRSEERKAWQSLVRVISHEINNSLSPIASISQTLNKLVSQQSGELPIHDDLIQGLNLIGERANGLRQFVESYKQLAKLPEPQKKPTSLKKLVDNLSALFKNQRFILESEADVQLNIDPVQFEQVLINIIKNAVEAMARNTPAGAITITWENASPYFKITLSDEGTGILNPDNLFVPFYSTKKNGSGIGLVLCRQIIEAHGGHFHLTNKREGQGSCATIELPLDLVGSSNAD